MLKKILSMKVAVMLLFLFGVAIGIATFIENDYGTQTARALIYSARWFEVFLLFFLVVIIYNMFKYKSYKKAKLSTFVFHTSFIIIGIGAGLTRYVGFEGIMHIREGSTSSTMVSDIKVLQIDATDGKNKAHFETPKFFSSMTKNYFSESLSLGDKDIDVELLEYLPAVEKQIVPDEKNGKMILSLKVSGGAKGKDIRLSEGEEYDAGSFIVTFGDISKHNDKKSYFNIKQVDGKLKVDTDFDLQTLSMLTREEQNLSKGINIFEKKKLYSFNKTNMVVLRDIYDKASEKFVNTALKTKGGKPEMTRFRVSVGDKSQEVTLLSFSGERGDVESLSFGDVKVDLSLGAKVINLPFAIKLNDFQLERYPGSNSPSSYASEVELIDKEQGIESMPFRIYMNHVLDHRNYRFFQSSYDRDERGTILSVNHDPGTLVTYIGYLMMIIGMFWNLFSKKSRFQQLLARAKKLQSSSLMLFASLLIFGISTPTYASPSINEANQTILNSYDSEVVSKFGRLIVQDRKGRMKPIDSLAHEIVSKLSGKTSIYGIEPTALFLGMTTNPIFFQDLPMIKISHTRVAQDIGLDKNAKFAKFSDFFDEKSGYKLAKQLEISARKKPFEKNQYDTQIIKIDERLSVAYMVYMGTLLQIYPIPHDVNNKWLQPQDAIKTFPKELSLMIRQITGHLFNGVEKGLKSSDWKDANEALKMMALYQKKFGEDVLLSDTHVDIEIKYNSFGLLSKIVPIYLIVGILLLILSFINILKPSFSLKWPMKISLVITIFGFILHLIGMGMRWYIAGHAPWSNAYESIVFISAATIVAGLFFARRSPFTLGATAFLAGVTLAVAHMNFVNPEITNLVPVLKSYWLMIHVALMIAGDGFFGLGSMLSLLILILFIIRKGGHENIDRAIKELSSTAEMSLIVGLFLFTMGNFLGGVWANESWGRYWGWDSKETWAAVSILIYATVLHLRFIPKYNNLFVFNVASLWAYSTVIMTYFGVNYYLSGLHSYAAGEPIPIPMWVYYGISGLLVLTLLAYRNRKMK